RIRQLAYSSRCRAYRAEPNCRLIFIINDENIVNHLFLHCRAGFEKECAAEISDLTAGLGIYGYSKTKDNSGYVLFITQEPDGAENIIRLLGFRTLIFTRQWFACAGLLEDLPVTDR